MRASKYFDIKHYKGKKKKNERHSSHNPSRQYLTFLSASIGKSGISASSVNEEYKLVGYKDQGLLAVWKQSAEISGDSLAWLR